MKRILMIMFIIMVTVSCRHEKGKVKSSSDENNGFVKYLDTLKEENSLKITMDGKPVTIVGKETKAGDTLKTVPLTINSKLEDKNIFEEKAIKVIYTAPSLDTKVCSIQTKILNTAAEKFPNVRFYSITVDTPFAQERFCSSNNINSLKPVSDYKYHQFGIQNGLLIKEAGLLTRALIIVDENNIVKYVEYVKEEGSEADVQKALNFLEEKILKR
ncbi:thiol peroxidase [Leptotrichia sp. OH3620_COT-345]|uniref:thiol peroxidase n=1 Tax=Leptotrichia sp. OH3620_COT-345 TaxID=2491048 RepID=UPI000F64FD63|nr:thiol peroxidase [Leptotrichia sp. OH3620_COT-345]RRD40474.1 thiol peroxidase [Leptotrichia sp. OH3620_COT-345]